VGVVAGTVMMVAAAVVQSNPVCYIKFPVIFKSVFGPDQTHDD